MDRTISTSAGLHGTVSVPGDKSISHRAVMIGALANGTTEIEGFLHAADPLSTISCFRSLGIGIRLEQERVFVEGKGLSGLRPSAHPLDAGNSGTTIRLISGILAGQRFRSAISGDRYLVKRPMKRIIDPLTAMGARIFAAEGYTAPLTIEPVERRLTAIEYSLPIASAQVKSAVLLAGLFAEGTTRVIEHEPSRDHTERMLNLPVERKGNTTIVSVNGGKEFDARPLVVPGDPSSAAFFIVAGLIVPNSEVVVTNVGLNPTRIGFLDVLQKMNGNISVENRRTVGGEEIGDVVVRSSHLRSDLRLEGELIPNIIDELPILSVAAAFAEGNFIVRGARDLRHKETDRITAVCSNLRAMGAETEEYDDGFAFELKKNLLPTTFNSFDDHRIAMSFGIAALALPGTSTIVDSHCVEISFPSFWETIQQLER